MKKLLTLLGLILPMMSFGGPLFVPATNGVGYGPSGNFVFTNDSRSLSLSNITSTLLIGTATAKSIRITNTAADSSYADIYMTNSAGMVFGRNAIDGGVGLVVGRDNTFGGEGGGVFGYSNVGYGQDIYVFGSGNTARASESVVAGYNNSVTNDAKFFNSIYGNYNSLRGEDSWQNAFGSFNIISAENASAFGNSLNNSTADSVEIGPNNTDKMRLTSAGLNLLSGPYIGNGSGLTNLNLVGTYSQQVNFTDSNNDFAGTFSGSGEVLVGDNEAYGAGWNNDLTMPTKNAVYDKIETIAGGSGIPTLNGSGTNTSLYAGDDKAILTSSYQLLKNNAVALDWNGGTTYEGFTPALETQTGIALAKLRATDFIYLTNNANASWTKLWPGSTISSNGWEASVIHSVTSTNGGIALTNGAANRVNINDAVAGVGNIKATGTATAGILNATLNQFQFNGVLVWQISGNDLYWNAANASTIYHWRNNASADLMTLNSSSGLLQVGAVSKLVSVGGTLKTDTTTTGNVGAGTDDLISYSIPAAQLAVNGSYLEFDVWGTCAANTNPKDITVNYGGTTLIDGGAVVLNGVSWKAHGKIVRTGATTQTANCELTVGGTLLSAVNGTITLTTSPTETLSGAVVFKCTGTSTVAPADNDIVQNGLVIKWFPGQ